MKKLLLFLTLSITASNFCMSQEWLTSFEAAKRIALVQNKFLFMIWEDAAAIPYPVIMSDENGNEVLISNLFDYDQINGIIWDYFVPVKVNESLYADLYDQIKGSRSRSYVAQFEDDNIKIMDANGNIVNTSMSPEAYFNLSKFVSKYALNTSFLNAELKNYLLQKDFGTAYRLASKYMDYAILVDKTVRPDIINLAEIYLDEADKFLLDDSATNKTTFEQKSSMLRLSKYLLLNRPNKVLRQLKKFKPSEIDDANQSLLSYLYHTSYQLKKDEGNAELWKAKVSEVDLRKSQLITNIHL
ncbi:hypothetical protein [Gelidibacter sp.]|uniref:hypothetical protein n=1 Tax=Gelidibacter sp. TaxID=2018083 RepID=UPI003267FA38